MGTRRRRPRRQEGGRRDVGATDVDGCSLAVIWKPQGRQPVPVVVYLRLAGPQVDERHAAELDQRYGAVRQSPWQGVITTKARAGTSLGSLSITAARLASRACEPIRGHLRLWR